MKYLVALALGLVTVSVLEAGLFGRRGASSSCGQAAVMSSCAGTQVMQVGPAAVLPQTAPPPMIVPQAAPQASCAGVMVQQSACVGSNSAVRYRVVRERTKLFAGRRGCN